ncbi:MAG TPA: hypothetical protein VMC79_06125 [Rectinemataceae bacterium]|nr:hypothetical protein [Rectinemataceae bacterium]
MSIDAADLKKLVKIIRQYEVIYGGGISTGDAAVREECESLVNTLESALKSAPRGRRGAESPLPSLVDAKKTRREEKPVRPVSTRATELAGLAAGHGSSRPTEEAPVAPSKTTAKGAARAASAKPTAASASAGPVPRTKAGGASAAKPGKAAGSGRANSKAAAPTAVRGKKTSSPQPERRVAAHKDSTLAADLRSAHKGAAKAAVERAQKRLDAGRTDRDASAGEQKKRFAAQHLFDAYTQNKLPKYGGFIVCVRFSEENGYTVIEIIGYENLQDIYPEGESLVFKSVGCKLFAIVEPPSYLLKSVEPVNRPSDQMVPYRFSELLHVTTKRFQNIYVGRKPVFMPTSFSVVKPEADDLAILFYDIADVYSNIQDFLIMMLRDRMSVPVNDSRKVAEVIARGIREFRLWLDEA